MTGLLMTIVVGAVGVVVAWLLNKFLSQLWAARERSSAVLLRPYISADEAQLRSGKFDIVDGVVKSDPVLTVTASIVQGDKKVTIGYGYAELPNKQQMGLAICRGTVKTMEPGGPKSVWQAHMSYAEISQIEQIVFVADGNPEEKWSVSEKDIESVRKQARSQLR